jgi:hypothetical protein
MRKRACLATLLLAAACLATSVPPAQAQDKDAITEMARRRFQEGVKFFDQKRYEEARAAFVQAYALKHHPAVLLNLAQSEIRSGHVLEAARHFSAYLRESPNVSAAERAEAEKALAAARTKLGRIHVSVASGAEVLVDGEVIGQAPLPEAVDATPGSHIVEAKLGARSASATVSVQIGRSSNTTLSLEGGGAAAPPPPPPPPSAPPAPAPAPETQEKPAPEAPRETVPPASEANVQVSTQGREPFFTWLGHNGIGIAGVAATVVGVGVGTGFALAATKASDNADRVASQIEDEATRINVASMSICVDPRSKVESPESTYANMPKDQRDAEVDAFTQACSLLSDNLDKRKKDRAYATAGFVVAGVGFVATLTAYLLTSGKGASSGRGASSFQAVVLPVVGPGQTGLAVVGSF